MNFDYKLCGIRLSLCSTNSCSSTVNLLLMLMSFSMSKGNSVVVICCQECSLDLVLVFSRSCVYPLQAGCAYAVVILKI